MNERMFSVFPSPTHGWCAQAVDVPGVRGTGRTPVDALRALLDMLDEARLEECPSPRWLEKREGSKR